MARPFPRRLAPFPEPPRSFICPGYHSPTLRLFLSTSTSSKPFAPFLSVSPTAMRAFATLLAFAASALAYQVTEPTNSTGFSNDGSNTVSWDMVSSDPANFTIVLVNNVRFKRIQLAVAIPEADHHSQTEHLPQLRAGP